MTETFEEFAAAFRLSELTVYTNDSWTWAIRNQQPTLGSSILTLNTFCTRLSSINDTQAADFRLAVVTIENTLKELFGYDKINYLMLMMVDSHLHYHVIPRYAEPRTYDGATFVDNGWPVAPVLADDQVSEQQELLKSLQSTVSANLVTAAAS